MTAGEVIRIDFSPGWSATAVLSAPDAPGAQLLDRLQLPAVEAALVLNGGTADGTLASPELVDVVVHGLAPALLDHGWAVVTGGTDAGLFALLGRAAEARGCVTAPWIGVAPLGLVTWPGRGLLPAGPGSVALEPHHSHFVIVDAERWGDETAAMLATSAALATRGTPTVAVVAGGGCGTAREVKGHIEAGRPILCLDGSGRFADRLAAAAAGEPAADDELAALVHAGDVVTQRVGSGARAVAGLLEELVSRASRSWT